MKQYSIQSNGSKIFGVFVHAVDYETSVEFRGHVLRLINVILNSLETLNDRIDARSALSELGFIQIIEEMKTRLIELEDNLTDDEMDEDEELTLIKDQIKLYEKIQSDDDLQCMFESVNSSDADRMFAFLLKKSVQEGFDQELMRILSCLAVILRNSYVTGVVLQQIFEYIR